jgi:hypothetical protein
MNPALLKSVKVTQEEPKDEKKDAKKPKSSGKTYKLATNSNNTV